MKMGTINVFNEIETIQERTYQFYFILHKLFTKVLISINAKHYNSLENICQLIDHGCSKNQTKMIDLVRIDPPLPASSADFGAGDKRTAWKQELFGLSESVVVIRVFRTMSRSKALFHI